MPLILPGNVASALPTGYEVANSCRWNYADSPAMNKSQTAGNKKTWTYSWWCKRGEIGGSAEKDWFKVYASGSKLFHIRFNTNNTLYIEGETPNSIRLTTNRVFRDPSAWYHFALIMDTTQGTDTNRMKLFVNGTQETSFASVTYPTENGETAMNDSAATFYLGTTHSATEEFDGYMADVVLLDGTAAAIGDLGEFDEDSPTIWKPKDPSGLTFGNNGFHLDFKDSSNLGNDANGGTDFTESNLAATDQATDTPTNNFATWNPILRHHSSMTLAEGNLQSVTANGYSDDVSHSFFSTQAMTAGKWGAEFKVTEDGNIMLGVSNDIDVNQGGTGSGTYNFGYVASGYAYSSSDGKTYTSDTGSTYGDTYTTNDIIGVYLDLDNNKLYFSKNGTVQNSGTGVSITACDGSNPYFFCHSDYESAGTNTVQANFGNPIHSITSGNADANGYGNFEYTTTITGDGSSKSFLSLCTKNLGSDGG